MGISHSSVNGELRLRKVTVMVYVCVIRGLLLKT